MYSLPTPWFVLCIVPFVAIVIDSSEHGRPSVLRHCQKSCLNLACFVASPSCSRLIYTRFAASHPAWAGCDRDITTLSARAWPSPWQQSRDMSESSTRRTGTCVAGLIVLPHFVLRPFPDHSIVHFCRRKQVKRQRGLQAKN